MEWSGYWRYPTIGYNAGGFPYYNHPLTSLSAANKIACANDPETEWNNVITKLSLSVDYIQRKRAECLMMVEEDEMKFGSSEDVVSLVESSEVEPCPCTWWQGWRDRRFSFHWNAWYGGSLCYYQRAPFNHVIMDSKVSATQYCCYSTRYI